MVAAVITILVVAAVVDRDGVHHLRLGLRDVDFRCGVVARSLFLGQLLSVVADDVSAVCKEGVSATTPSIYVKSLTELDQEDDNKHNDVHDAEGLEQGVTDTVERLVKPAAAKLDTLQLRVLDVLAFDAA